jgi:CheY-like chemotaxis protein
MTMTQQPRVLVVEDEYLVRDMMVRDMIVHELTRAGFEVLEAANAEDAMALLPKAERIDLLFTDIKLPGMDGWQLAEKIRGLQADVPVIYASAYAGRVSPLPRSKFLQKPYMPSQVLQAAANLGIKLPLELPPAPSN